jgi:surface antigen
MFKAIRTTYWKHLLIGALIFIPSVQVTAVGAESEKGTDSIKVAAAEPVKAVPTVSMKITEALYVPPPPPQDVYSSYNSYPFGQCTYLVAAHRNIPWTANAKDWWWQAAYYPGFQRGQIPLIGAIMVSSEGNFLGHVSLVTQVIDINNWIVEEMNYYGVPGGGWGKVDFRPVNRFSTYIYGFIY